MTSLYCSSSAKRNIGLRLFGYLKVPVVYTISRVGNEYVAFIPYEPSENTYRTASLNVVYLLKCLVTTYR